MLGCLTSNSESNKQATLKIADLVAPDGVSDVTAGLMIIASAIDIKQPNK